MKKEIKTKNAPAFPEILSQAIEANGFVFISGQVHDPVGGEVVNGTTEEKTKIIMGNLKAILEAAGLTFDDVVKVNVYFTDLSERAKFNEIYSTYFKAPLPAREAIGVKELPAGASIEISMIAAR